MRQLTRLGLGSRHTGNLAWEGVRRGSKYHHLLYALPRRGYGRIREELAPSLNLKGVLHDREIHVENCRNRRVCVDLDAIERLYGQYRVLTASIQEQRGLRRRMAGRFVAAVGVGEALDTLDDSHAVRMRIDGLEGELRMVQEALTKHVTMLPNLTHPSAPIGGSEANAVVDTFGPDPRPGEGALVDHVELGRRLGIVDFEGGARTSGSGFYFLKGRGALLENALVQYALCVAMKHGFIPVLPPDIVKSKFIRACGFFPRDEEDAAILPVYTAEVDGDQETETPLKVLAATGEIPLAAYHAGQTLLALTGEGAKRYVAVSHCFRPETGHHGADSRGLYRVHQFTKVELFIVKDDAMETSDTCLQDILALQKEILTGLELRCRTLNMATGELGASAYQKYDIEAYFPFRKGYGEVTSASNCTDYQARRMAIRYRDEKGELRFAHTLNGTAMAIPRIIQAIMENGQTDDGKGGVTLPAALHPYMLDGSRGL